MAVRKFVNERFSGNVLASVIGSALIAAVAGGAVTVAVTNNNNDTVTAAGAEDADKQGPTSTSTTTTTAPRPSPLGATPSTSPAFPVRYDPSENGSAVLSRRSFRYFFDRALYVEIESISRQGNQFVLSRLTVQEGVLARCTFENVHNGRFFYRRSEREYELTISFENEYAMSVNIAEWTGRTTFAGPCAGEGATA